MSEPTETISDAVVPEPRKAFSRDEIRAAFSNAKPKAKPLTIFGVDIELREPPLEAVLDAQDMESRKEQMGMMMVRYVYTTTGEPVFEQEDVDMLMSVPFGPDMQALNKAIQDLLGVVPDKETKSPPTE